MTLRTLALARVMLPVGESVSIAPGETMTVPARQSALTPAPVRVPTSEKESRATISRGRVPVTETVAPLGISTVPKVKVAMHESS